MYYIHYPFNRLYIVGSTKYLLTTGLYIRWPMSNAMLVNINTSYVWRLKKMCNETNAIFFGALLVMV